MKGVTAPRIDNHNDFRLPRINGFKGGTAKINMRAVPDLQGKQGPLSSECGTYAIVKTRIWPRSEPFSVHRV